MSSQFQYHELGGQSNFYLCSCGCKWLEPPLLPPLEAIKNVLRSPPWYDPCVKCGTKEGHDVQHVQIANLAGTGPESLRLTCRFCNYEHDVPTMDAKLSEASKP